MAENKKSFVLYTDIIHVFANLTDDEAGKLVKHLLMYVNDLNPQTDNRIIQIAFEPIKLQLKRDLKHWESVIDKRKGAGKLGGLAKASKTKQSLANLAVNVNVNDTVTVNVNNINIPFDSFWNLYNKKVGDKKKSEIKWKKLKDEERKKIIDTLPLFLNSITDKQYQPFPETYLNNKRWNDEIIENINSNKKHYFLSSPFGKWNGNLSEEEYKAKTLTGHWTLIKVENV